MAIVMDGCVLSDNDTKCDALFLYHRGNRKYSFLVELKGAAEIEKAFYQLSYTRFQRYEYKNIIKKFNDIDQIFYMFHADNTAVFCTSMTIQNICLSSTALFLIIT